MENYFRTTDIKLEAFLRLIVPTSFVGINKENPQKVTFLFQRTPQIVELATGYLDGKKYEISPLAFANKIDEGKGLIFGDFEM